MPRTLWLAGFIPPARRTKAGGVMTERHEAASTHFRGTPEVRSFRGTSGPDPHLCIAGEAHATAQHYRTYGQSEVRVDVYGEATVFLSPEQAEAVVAQLTAHLVQMGRMRQAETVG